MPEPDVIRSFALFAVIAQHISGAWAAREGVGPVQAALISALFEFTRFAVPAFVFLFGMMLAGFVKKKFDAVRYILKRIAQIILPYMVWSLLYMLIFGKTSGAAEYIMHILRGSASYHLWYVPMIFQFVLLAPLFVKLFRRTEGMKKSYAAWGILLFISFAWLLFLAFCGNHVSEPVLGRIWKYQSLIFPSWMFYFTAGAAFCCNSARLCVAVRRYFPALLAVAAIGTAVIMRADILASAESGVAVFNVVGLQKWYYAAFLPVIFACLYRLAMFVSRFRVLSSFFGFCSMHSYRAYLIHAAVIHYINLSLVSSFRFLPLYYLLLFLLSCAFSLVLASLIDRFYALFRSRL